MTVIIDGTNGVQSVGGSATITSFTAIGDTNTGIFFPAADTIAFAEGGVEVARFDSSGNLGLGTSTPDAPVQIAKSSATSGVLINAQNTTTGSLIQFACPGVANVRFGAPNADAFVWQTFGSGSYPERMRLDASGRLLVGTTTDSKNLRLSEKLAVVHAGSNTYAGMAVTGYSGTASGARPIIDINRSRGSTDGSMTKVENADILGSIIFRGSDGTNFQDSSMITAEIDGATGAGDVPGRLIFLTSSDGSETPTERCRITSGGSFLVGTTTATGPGRIVSITNGFDPASTDNWKKAAFTGTGDYGGAIAFVNTGGASDGFCLFTTGAPSQLNVRFGANGGNANSNGVYLTSTGTSWTANSDERMKADLVPIADAVNKVLQLRSVTGRFKTDPEGMSRAFLIAQDVQKVLPEAVSVADDEQKTLGVQYTEVIPLLVAAIKELQAEIAALKGA